MFNRALVWMIAISYSISENSYFGWNLLAKSEAELICDGFQAILFVAALLNPISHKADSEVDK